MKHIHYQIIDSYMTDQEKIQQAWLDLDRAVHSNDLKAVFKYSNYIKFLLKKITIEV